MLEKNNKVSQLYIYPFNHFSHFFINKKNVTIFELDQKFANNYFKIFLGLLTFYEEL